MSEEGTKRYRIGYALAQKKVQSFIQPSLLNLAKERGIDLVPIHLTKPLIDQNPFDCIIHKLSDPDWINQLQQFLSRFPNVVVIDHPDAIERLHNRVTMLQVVDELKITHEISLGNPKQVFAESRESPLFESKGMIFPVIAKPLAADGGEDSHQMFLVLNKEGLGELKLKLKPPFVLQEFVNHGGVIFKVYVAGEHVRCVKRRSLPDISEGELCLSENLVPFSRISNLTAEDQSGDSVEKLVEAAELPPSSFVTEVATELRQALRLNLFNFDMIRDGRVGDRYLVIDINYFPGYAKMPGYETMLTDFFLDVVQQKQSGS
ncbi:hypothetical protein BUALT_Bualt06G0146200 [Buddleja alternifolia]|uniref:Inositol-tetrakisphosphate 1-kinase n=1 Tax=Buddleja alternifolia TaxID=168488 RepID=A0AAV6XRL6_9LAMI|nr:hypothetical protein BUALT_Bualt06G0146200 [Buddleja alternifolia]